MRMEWPVLRWPRLGAHMTHYVEREVHDAHFQVFYLEIWTQHDFAALVTS